MINKNTALKYWVHFVLWAAIIFIFSSIPGDELPETRLWKIDKAAHLVEFFIFGILLIRALKESFKNFKIEKLIISAIIISSCYAAFDEAYQHFVPGRTVSLADFVFDFTGACFGIIFYKRRG